MAEVSEITLSQSIIERIPIRQMGIISHYGWVGCILKEGVHLAIDNKILHGMLL